MRIHPGRKPAVDEPEQFGRRRAIWDDQLGCWVSDAEVAETSYAAFTSKKDKELHVTARLIVRRVRDKADAASRALTA